VQSDGAGFVRDPPLAIAMVTICTTARGSSEPANYRRADKTFK